MKALAKVVRELEVLLGIPFDLPNSRLQRLFRGIASDRASGYECSMTVELKPRLDEGAMYFYFLVYTDSPLAIPKLTPQESVTYASNHLQAADLALKAEEIVRGLSWHGKEYEAFVLDKEKDA